MNYIAIYIITVCIEYIEYMLIYLNLLHMRKESWILHIFNNNVFYTFFRYQILYTLNILFIQQLPGNNSIVLLTSKY